MRVNDLTPGDMEKLMRRLATNFGGKKDLDDKCDLYFDKLKVFPLAIVARAVDRAIDAGGEYFPKVHKIVGHARDIERQEAGVDDSPRARLRAWWADPFGDVEWTEEEKRGPMPSKPCPVCGERLEWSPRGYVIVHDDVKHAEAQASYSNVGRPEWYEMGPPVMPVLPKKAAAATPIAAIVPGDAAE